MTRLRFMEHGLDRLPVLLLSVQDFAFPPAEPFKPAPVLGPIHLQPNIKLPAFIHPEVADRFPSPVNAFVAFQDGLCQGFPDFFERLLACLSQLSGLLLSALDGFKPALVA
ncbi:MAG: hypothetical protein ACO4CS_04000 [bacterium]